VEKLFVAGDGLFVFCECSIRYYYHFQVLRRDGDHKASELSAMLGTGEVAARPLHFAASNSFNQ
jgi:hypothetical protein